MTLAVALTLTVLAQGVSASATPAAPAARDSGAMGRARLSLSAGVGLRTIVLTRQLKTDYALTTCVGLCARNPAAGLSPTQLRLSGAWFPWRMSRLLSAGVAADGTAEWYVASGDETDETSLNDLSRKQLFAVRGGAGLAARWQPQHWLGLEARLGWAGISAPALDASSGVPTPQAAKAHGPFLALVASADPGGFWAAEVFARGTPLVGALGSDTTLAKTVMLSGGAQLALGGLETSGVRGSVVLEYAVQAIRPIAAAGSEPGTARYSELTHHVGLGVRVVLGVVRAAPEPTGPGTLRGQVQAEGKPLAGATVSVAGATALTDPLGQFQLGSVGPGPVSGKVEAPGFDAKVLEALVPPGGAVEVAVTLERHKPTGPGAVKGVVQLAPGKPVAKLEVLVEGGVPVVTDDEGRFELAGVAPGVVSVLVRGKGYKPLTEAVRVAPEATAEVTLTVTKAGDLRPGIIRGFIQAANGKAITATVRVVETKRSVKIGPNGRFEVTVPAGRYTLTISAPGFVTQTQSVELAGGDHAIFHCQLQPVAR